MFTGASQFAMVGVIGSGGSVWAGAATAALLGTRNALYGMRLSSQLGVRGARRALASHFVIDETTAMAIARDSVAGSRLAFWATGALASAAVALIVLPFVPAGIPLLIVAAAVALLGLFRGKSH